MNSISGVLALLRRGLFVLAAILTAAPSMGQDPDPKPWTGEPGITETVDQIMARDHLFPPPAEPRTTGKPKRVSPDRSLLPQAPGGLGELAAWPPLPQGVPAITPPGYQGRSPQTLGTSFNGVLLSEAGFIPPDTIGDVSPTQIIAAANGRIKVFSKTGVLGALNTTMDTFFNSVRNASGISDPVVRYDRITGRWFVIAINVSTPNRIVLAVSGTGAITGTASFTFFQFQQDLVGTTPNADTGNFADYCTLGVDANALYIGCRMFSPFYGCTGWVVRKSSMTSGGPIVVTAFRQMTTTASGPDAPRGVSNDDAAATEGYFIGADVAVFSRLVVRRILTPGGTPTMSGNLLINVPTTATPVNVPAQGSTTALEAVDDRLFAAHVRKNRATGVATLWTSHAIETNSAGTGTASGDRDSMRWYEIQSLTTTPALRQSGTLFDTAAATPRWYWMGSCNMSGQGHMAIGASFAATDEFAGCAAAGRLSGDTLGTTQAPTDIIAGAAAYNQISGGRNRWGDYSHTVVDPADDMTMWTFQEFTNAANSWSVRAVQLRAPPPATPASCSPVSVAQGAVGANIVLTGTVVSGSGFFDPDATFPNHIAASIGGTGVTVNSVTWTNATTATLNVTVTAGATLGARTVTVTNPDGQALTSASGILTITAGGCTAPTITTQPTNAAACVGANASFTAAASGSPAPTFQWRRGATNLVNGGTISGATSATLTITGVVVGDAAADYNCVATNACGSATTSNATLTVNTAPAITTQPVALTRCTGTSASFTVAASGTPAPTFQWQKNAVNIAGATSSTFTIASVVVGDAANYRCIVTNTCGSATSNSVALTVNTGPAITTQPVALTRCTGTSASFTVAASGTPAPTFQWQKNAVNIGGATSSTFTIASVVVGDAANYQCVVTNACGSVTSNSVALTVNTGPAITTQPVALTRCTGTSASFTVAASGTPAPTFQWQKNAVNIGGATSATFTIASVVVGDAANYQCVVTNSCGSVTSSSVALTVNTAPAITTQPTGSTRCTGDEYTFSLVASGTPAPSFQWRLNGSPIAGATGPALGLNGITLADAGAYDCVVTNSCGSVTSNAVALTVNTGPAITTQPVALTRCTATSASFTVAASGTPAPTFQWQKDAVDIVGATGTTFTIASVAFGDAANYQCVVTNICGSVTSNSVALTVNTPPSISTQPVGSTRCAGDEYTIFIGASGSPTLTYQWRLNGSPIVGATGPALGLNGITLADAGDYDCIVTNSCGSATSDPASLIVTSGPTITTQPVNDTVSTGGTGMFTVAASGSTPLSYQWRKNTSNISDGGSISGALTPSLTISPAALADAGTYDCIVSNSCGSADSDDATLVVTGCLADVDDGSGTGTPDGGVTIEDLIFYLFAFDNGDVRADVDDGTGTGTPDGGITIEDLLYYLLRFDAGC